MHTMKEIKGGGATMTMTMQPLDFANGHGQNDHFDHDHKTFGITKWSWSNGQNYQNKIIKFKFNNFNSMVKNVIYDNTTPL